MSTSKISVDPDAVLCTTKKLIAHLDGESSLPPAKTLQRVSGASGGVTADFHTHVSVRADELALLIESVTETLRRCVGAIHQTAAELTGKDSALSVDVGGAESESLAKSEVAHKRSAAMEAGLIRPRRNIREI